MSHQHHLAAPCGQLQRVEITAGEPLVELDRDAELGARELGIAPEGCWYVGDSTWDMEAAAAAGMLPIAVVAGAAVAREELIASGARAVLETLDELIGLLPA